MKKTVVLHRRCARRVYDPGSKSTSEKPSSNRYPPRPPSRHSRDDPRPAETGDGRDPITMIPWRTRPASSSPAVPGWAVASAALSPVVMIGGWLAAEALQPSSYSPVRSTISGLAGLAEPAAGS
jgi:hypothetical protein